MKFHHCCTPWKISFGHPWKTPLLPSRKETSDIHVQGMRNLFFLLQEVWGAICNLKNYLSMNQNFMQFEQHVCECITKSGCIRDCLYKQIEFYCHALKSKKSKNGCLR